MVRRWSTAMSRVAGLGWLRGVWEEDIDISRPIGRKLLSEGAPSAGGEALKEERRKQGKREPPH